MHELDHYLSLRVEVTNAAMESLEKMREGSKKVTLQLGDILQYCWFLHEASPALRMPGGPPVVVPAPKRSLGCVILRGDLPWKTSYRIVLLNITVLSAASLFVFFLAFTLYAWALYIWLYLFSYVKIFTLLVLLNPLIIYQKLLYSNCDDSVPHGSYVQSIKPFN